MFYELNTKEFNNILSNYRRFILNLTYKQLLSISFEEGIYLKYENWECHFLISNLVEKDDKRTETYIFVATAVDIPLCHNPTLQSVWLNLWVDPYPSSKNQKLLADCTRQMLHDQAFENLAEAIKLEEPLCFI